MEAEKKLKKIKRKSKKSKKKLLDLIKVKASKKKILKQVRDIKELEQKRIKFKSKSISKKGKTTKSSSKKIDTTPKAISSNGQPMVSTTFNARQAIQKLAGIKSLEQLKSFVKLEKRKTVLDRAKTLSMKLEQQHN